jgi:hypothetical protein
MMPGNQLEKICIALNSAFSEMEFKKMLRFRLNRNLDDMASHGPKEDRVFEVVSRSENEGWLSDLIHEAHQYYPRNEELLNIYTKYVLAVTGAQASQGVPTVAVGSLAHGLRSS